MSNFVVAYYDIDRAYGGPEEGGWWYDCGTLVRLSKVFKSEDKAYLYARRINTRLDAYYKRHRIPSTRGRVYAEVWPGVPPHHYPERRPHYE